LAVVVFGIVLSFVWSGLLAWLLLHSLGVM